MNGAIGGRIAVESMTSRCPPALCWLEATECATTVTRGVSYAGSPACGADCQTCDPAAKRSATRRNQQLVTLTHSKFVSRATATAREAAAHLFAPNVPTVPLYQRHLQEG